jgi:6-phosphogluconate dehydrogenase
MAASLFIATRNPGTVVQTAAQTAFDIGIVGLGVMGSNLALNLVEHGFAVIGLDRNPPKIAAFRDAARRLRADVAAEGTTEVASFVAKLRRPRVILLLLPAGPAVDAMIGQLLPHLQRQDILIDGGNSHFSDTERRMMQLASSCVQFVGMGISGGESGARHGPSLMPGGAKAAWERTRPMLEAIAAKVEGIPCVAHLGRNAAGHYVKMVHNGIEYGLMQLIAESYDLMKRGLGLTPEETQAVFAGWARGELSGFLIEITADILTRRDPENGGYLIDKILDAARQKGTGMWTSQEAMAQQVPTPVIDAAVSMRGLSDYKEQRVEASRRFGGTQRPDDANRDVVLAHLARALDGAMILAYAQGLHLLHRGGRERRYAIPLGDVCRVWRGGCIIRARLLEELRAAYARNPKLDNPIFDEPLAARLKAGEDGLRAVVQFAARAGVPAPGFMAALGYYDAWRSAVLPANLIQAQRDYFGAHKVERIDRPGAYHIAWTDDDKGHENGH